MGNDQSQIGVPQANFVRPYTNDIYMPIDAARTDNERGAAPMPVTNFRNKPIRTPTLLRTAFTGIWSIIIPNCICPAPRTGNFFCHDKNTSTTYIGYGLNTKNEPLYDFWALNHLTNRWREIKLTGTLLCARTGARAALIGNHIVVFGGYNDPNYFSDLHTIDINTGKVELIKTQGPQPVERSTPVVDIYNNKFYLWGGFNGEFQTDLFVLDFATMTWSQYPQNVSGRTAVPHAIIGNILYIYGGSKSGGMLMLNLDTYEMIVKQTTGSEPPSAVMASGMVAVNKYLFFFGGKANSSCTLMYACDTSKLWWFVFHVMPDGETVSLVDGTISEMGLFMVPRIHSFAVAYVKQTRQIVAFLGDPPKDPPPLFTVSIGDAMAFINLREDMSTMLKLSILYSNGNPNPNA